MRMLVYDSGTSELNKVFGGLLLPVETHLMREVIISDHHL
jgi:hypothetical protein